MMSAGKSHLIWLNTAIAERQAWCELYRVNKFPHMGFSKFKWWIKTQTLSQAVTHLNEGKHIHHYLIQTTRSWKGDVDNIIISNSSSFHMSLLGRVNRRSADGMRNVIDVMEKICIWWVWLPGLVFPGTVNAKTTSAHLAKHDLTLTISMVRLSFFQLSMCGVCYVAAEKFYEAKAGKIYII